MDEKDEIIEQQKKDIENLKALAEGWKEVAESWRENYYAIKPKTETKGVLK